jgi:hypothetical protein
MPTPYYIPNPAIRCEQVILNYVSASLSNTGLVDPDTSWFTGMASQNDKMGPACVVACNSAQETYLQTRVYRFNVDIATSQIAADSTTSSISTGSIMNFAGNVHSLFGDTYTASAAINAITATGTNDFYVIQTRIMDYQNSRHEDAWIANLNVEIVAGLM